MERAGPIVNSFASVIRPRSRIIDIGAGKGLLAQAMSERFGACVTMVDVARYNQTNLPLTVCDSRALAFASDSFDYAVLSFVLHHCNQPDAILREALRVAPQVIVVENDVRGMIRGAVTRLVDSYPALRFGTPPCYIAQSHADWLKLLAEFPVEIQMLKRFSLEYGFFQNFTVLLTKRD
ncbi:MAG: class I SAM-dependent methyltransferase [Chloroflexi bacterium]|nr:class I SAM-dependent methyltransferase [Chloroflexota bacterium]